MAWRKGIIFFASATFLLGVFLASPLWAEGIPPLETIVRKVVKNTDPQIGYRVDVNQTVLASSSEQDQDASTLFTIFYDPQ